MKNDEMIEIPGASCRIWFDGPSWDGEPAAAIGDLRVDDPAAGVEMMTRVRALLAGRGVRAALAPMDGDTWHSYRAVTETDGSAAFPLEPRAGDHDASSLEAAGFSPVSSYVSTRMPLPDSSPRATEVEGVRIVAWDGQGAEGLLERLFAVASGSFAEKAFFKPIGKEEFLGLYRPVLSMVDPRMVLFAFDAKGDMVGFLFGIPDHTNGAAVLKTYAGSLKGVGHMMAERFHQVSHEMGFSHVVHALMHSDNVSLERSSQHGATTFRRYALFGIKLA
jgi:hypothetical protein